VTLEAATSRSAGPSPGAATPLLEVGALFFSWVVDEAAAATFSRDIGEAMSAV